jgi:hypothetical protein
MSFSDSKVVRDVVKAGAQTAVAIPLKFVVPAPAALVGVYVSLGTAPTGATTFKVDVNKNGTTVFTDQADRPTFVAGEFTAKTVAKEPVAKVAAPSGANFSTGYYADISDPAGNQTAQGASTDADPINYTPSSTNYVPLGTFAAGDTVSVDVDAVGNTVAGSDLVVTLVFDQI